MGLLRSLLVAALAILSGPSWAAGTLPIVLQQQFAFTGCSTTPTTAACGQPLAGGLLYFYQVGTVATRQDSFQDTGLSIANPWPLQLDQNGRIPPFYLADGSIHVRLTDSGGVVQFDYPAMLVIGPSSGGGGGASIDPTTIAGTGDVKWRPSAETLNGWIKLNGTTIGSATSGATQRANADTQSLYVYLWTQCTTGANTHCPVSGGIGANALADFNANKPIQVPDMRDFSPMGLDCMGGSCAGRLDSGNMAGGDTTDTRGGVGGQSTVTIAQNQLPNIAPIWTNTAGTYTPTGNNASSAFTATNSIASHIATSGSAFTSALLAPSGGTSVPNCNGSCTDLNTYTPTGTAAAQTWTATNSYTPTGTVASINGNVTQQKILTQGLYMLGTWFMKL